MAYYGILYPWKIIWNIKLTSQPLLPKLRAKQIFFEVFLLKPSCSGQQCQFLTRIPGFHKFSSSSKSLKVKVMKLPKLPSKSPISSCSWFQWPCWLLSNLAVVDDCFGLFTRLKCYGGYIPECLVWVESTRRLVCRYHNIWKGKHGRAGVNT